MVPNFYNPFIYPGNSLDYFSSLPMGKIFYTQILINDQCSPKIVDSIRMLRRERTLILDRSAFKPEFGHFLSCDLQKVLPVSLQVMEVPTSEGSYED